MSFTVIMPIKPWDGAKSRLHPDADARMALAASFARDTLDAVLRCPEVGHVVVVTRGEQVNEFALNAGAIVVQEPTDGGADPLGAAVREGAAWALAHHPLDAVAVIPSDLPALTTSDLSQLLLLAAGHPLAFVPDANGDGTTILTSQSPSLLQAGYGPDSASRHRSFGAVELTATPGLRRDVDEFHELVEAKALGLGPHTASALAALSSREPVVKQAG
ncbi:MAG: 2-phospho-L-lactate guanylyltransferase [Aeromicrobium sp.]